MAHNESRVGQRVDKIRVSDEPHDCYRKNGTPVLANTPIGKVVEKEVTAYSLWCPECSVPAEYNHNAEPVCPVCGLICDGEQGEEITREAQLVVDAKSAGRIASDRSAKS